MKEYFLKYAPSFKFLGIFLSVYILLTLTYYQYLKHDTKSGLEVDEFTELVGWHTEKLLLAVTDNVYMIQHPEELSLQIFYHGRFIARVVEGCNAISIIIIFIAFVVSFPGKFKETFFFIIAGSLVIHILNILRIAFLVIIINNYPEYENLMHGVLFPLSIYGVVLLLWGYWLYRIMS